MEVNLYHSTEEIGQTLWNSLCGTDYPFIRYDFLHALGTACTRSDDEDSESNGAACSRKWGWQPYHAIVFELSSGRQQAVAAVPMYLKYHSDGEYIFDWAWADAFHRNGLNYYPKLLAAIPY